MTHRIEDLGTILGVWAHPDDEAYLSAGLMALARQRGQRVVVVTATDGEAGNTDPQRWSTNEFVAIRREELAASLAAVGVEEHHCLELLDGHCDRLPLGVGTALVQPFIHTVRPDTIVTFGPDGMTGHADHRAVSAWVTAAWKATGRRARLWHATLTPEFHHRWSDLNDELSIWMSDDPPPSTPTDRVAFTVDCRGRLTGPKVRALQAHATQTAGLISHVGEATFAQWWADEWFVDAHVLLEEPKRYEDGSAVAA